MAILRDLGRTISRRSLLARWGRAAILTASVASAAAVIASPPARNPFDATNSDEARLSALRSIPYDQLDAEARAKVEAVLANVSVYRRMPIRIVESDPDLFHFLVRHPDVVVNIWEALGASQIQLREIAKNTFRIHDAGGTVAVVQMIHKSKDTYLIYADGCYQGPLVIRPAKGRCLLILRTGTAYDPDGRCFVTARLDSFLNLESNAAELITKAFEPLVGKIADANFIQSVSFVGSLSQTAQTNPRGVKRLASKLDHVQPEIREELAGMVERIATNAPPPRLGSLPTPAAK
jgi:hypothetical protein